MNKNLDGKKLRMISKQLAEFDQLTSSELFAPMSLDIFVQ
jgi:hypothetical protein